MTIARSALYFLVGFLAVVNVGLAYAEDYPPTSKWQACGSSCDQDTFYSSATNACRNNNASRTDIAIRNPSYTTFGGQSVISRYECWQQANMPPLYMTYEQLTGTAQRVYQCPYGGTLDYTQGKCINAPTCEAGYQRNPTTGQCEPIPEPEPEQCPTGTTDYGVFPKPATGENVCKSSGGGQGCGETFTSVPEGDGYRWTGTNTGACSTTDQPETCTETSPKFLGYVNDKPFCATSGETPTPDPDPDPDPEPEEPGEGGDGSEGGCPDGQTWVPGTSGGAGSCVNGSGDGGGGETGGGTGGTGGSGGTGGGDGTGDGTGTGGGDTGGGSGDGSGTGGGSGDGEGEGECTGEDCEEGGTPAEIGDIYEKKDKTFGDVLGGFQQKVSEAPFVAAASGFFTVNASGSCPIWSRTVPLLGTITIDHFCSSTALYWLGIAGYAILALASFTAFRWAFL